MDTRTLKKHLTDIHKSDLYQLTDDQLFACNLYLCRVCDSQLCDTEKQLSTHLAKHIKRRTRTNLDICTALLYADVETIHQNHWREGLHFLRTTKFAEPTFRQTLITSIRDRLETSVLHAFNACIEAAVLSSQEASEIRLRADPDFDANPVWKLVFCFERLVLAPNPNPLSADRKTGISTNQLIHERLRLLRSGQIQKLYLASNEVVSRTPSSFAADPVSKQRSAQIAADNNNFKTANARLTNDTPVARVNDDNIDVLHELHPKSLGLNLPRRRRDTRGSANNFKRLIIHPSVISKVLSKLKRGKAPGIELDSLDIFVKLADSYRRAKKRGQRTPFDPRVLAEFFTILANGEAPPQIKEIIRTTYLVALRKDADDPRKLRPLGIPSAIRRITALAVLTIYKTRLAEYLLPYNFAFGVHGGVDMVTTSVRLAVEKYITTPELQGLIPSRCLISLDIRNMFNAISREKLLQLVDRDFPELSAFAYSLYSEYGHTVVRRDDGTWERIEVQEGFSQGCPASPVFAAIVLNHILKKIDQALTLAAFKRCGENRRLDDDQGGRPLLFTYVDDGNMIIPLEDVPEFLRLFKLWGEPLGCILNTEKTRILTSTTGTKVTTRLLDSANESDHSLGQQLVTTIAQYSRTKPRGSDTYEAVEVVDGLRILGAPIGSFAFCNDFVLDMARRASACGKAIMDGLDDQQTIFQLFRTCTAHKLTHLFAADVVNTSEDNLPKNWHLFRSDLVASYSTMLEDFLSRVLQQPSLPPHVQVITSMSTSGGGLGFPHPRSSAIPSFVLTTRRAIQYALSGIFIGRTAPLAQLTPQLRNLYKDWQTSSSATFTRFRRYASDIAKVCVSDRLEQDQFDFFLKKSSLTTCRDRIRLRAARRARHTIEHLWARDAPSLAQLGDLLDPKMAASLMDLSRTTVSNRRRDDDFRCMLKRKLRLPLWNDLETVTCFCGKVMDAFGDHCLSCRRHCKTTMHNHIRDGLWELLKYVFPLARLCSTETSVDREPLNIVRGLPQLRPFDISVFYDPMVVNSPWRTSITRFGFDVTVVSSKPLTLPSTLSTAAQKNEIKLRLRDGEKIKFQRRGASDQGTKVTLSGDEIMKEIISKNMALIPIAVSPHGTVGSLFNRFMYGDEPLPSPKFAKDRIHAPAADRVARSRNVPRGILIKATEYWRKDTHDIFFGDYYKATDPRRWFDQQFGLVISKAISSHLLRAYNRHKTKRAKECFCPDGDCGTTPIRAKQGGRSRRSTKSNLPFGDGCLCCIRGDQGIATCCQPVASPTVPT